MCVLTYFLESSYLYFLNKNKYNYCVETNIYFLADCIDICYARSPKYKYFCFYIIINGYVRKPLYGGPSSKVFFCNLGGGGGGDAA